MLDKIKGSGGSRRLWLNGQEISPERSQKARDHSPDGFNWGYGGSGPSQTALAVLLAHGLSTGEALRLYQGFKWEHVANWPQGRDFEATINLAAWVEKERARGIR